MEYNGKEVVLMACSSCNIKRCKHCYISYNGDRDPKELKDLASFLKSKKYDVYINGSEVLINHNYLKSFSSKSNAFVFSRMIFVGFFL